MGYVPPPPPPPRLNLDRFGLPRDFATYMWVVYGRHVVDDSPTRRAFLGIVPQGWEHPNFGVQVSYR
jgi:hypothetical protein